MAAEQQYRLVFERAETTNVWADVVGMGAIGIASLGLLAVLVAWGAGMFGRPLPRPMRSAIWFLVPISLVLGSVMLFGTVQSLMRENAVAAAVKLGKLKTVKGCLDHYENSVGSSRGYSSHEHWRVEGVEFDYSLGESGTGFHTPAADGGPMRADSRVRVTYAALGKNSNPIVRLEVIDHGCPPAPAPSYTP